MSDLGLREAGRALYKLSREISKKDFLEAVKARRGINCPAIYVLPLDKRPYCVVITRKYQGHKIELGKANNLDFTGSISCIPFEWEEGQMMTDDVLNTVNGFIDFAYSKSTCIAVSQEVVTPAQSIHDMILKVIDGHNLSEILSMGDFRGQIKRQVISEVEKLQKDGTVKFEEGKFRRLKW